MAKSKETIELEVKSNVGEVSKDAAGLASEFKIMGVSLNSLKLGFVSVGKTAKAMFATMKAGIMSTGIGALLIAVTALISYFTNTKRGADKLAQGMSALGAVVDAITDAFSKLGETMVAAFENPQKAVEQLWEIIQNQLVNRLDGLIMGFGALGDVIKSVFTLDFEGAAEGAKAFGDALLQTSTGLDAEQRKEFVDSIKEMGAEIAREAAAMAALTKRTQQLRDADNAFMIQKAATRQEIEKARLIAEDETKSAQERLDNLKKALELEASTTEKEIALAKERMLIQQAEMALSENSAQDEQDLARLKADIIEKETASVKMRRRVVTEVNALEREIAAEKKARAKEDQDAEDAKIAKAESEAAILLALQQENTLALIKDLKTRALEELRIQEEKEIASAELLENSEAVKAEIRKKFDRLRNDADAKFSKKQVKWSKMTKDEQLGIASSTAGDMAKIMGEETEAGKAFAITQATIDTYKSATSAYSAMSGIPVVGPALGAVAAGAAIAAGLANVAAISSTGGGGGGGGGGGSVPAAPAPPAPQMMSGAFELTGGEAPEPLRAYVVTDEMTNSQNQLANIRRRSTI